jgi:hypothetical protein
MWGHFGQLEGSPKRQLGADEESETFPTAVRIGDSFGDSLFGSLVNVVADSATAPDIVLAFPAPNRFT